MNHIWILLGSSYDLLEDRCKDNNHPFPFYMKQTDSMLPWVCSVTVSNRSQKISKCGKNMCDTLGCTSFTIYFVLITSSVIYYWTDTHAKWNLLLN